MCVCLAEGESEARSGVASELRSPIVLGGVDFYEDISRTNANYKASARISDGSICRSKSARIWRAWRSWSVYY